MSTRGSQGTDYADNYRKILLRDSGNGSAQFDERPAGTAITPGMLVRYNANDKVVFNNVADDPVGELLFALEDNLQGRTIDDDYAIDDLCKYCAVKPGDQVYAIASEAIAVGAKVGSTGNGKVKTYVSGRVLGFVVAIASTADGDRVILQIV
jgi:hypothetical protein